MEKETFYIITYKSATDGEVLTLKATTVFDSPLGLSFIAISDFIFNTDSLIVNSAEEDQRKKFESVNTIHLSIYTIISIEEVGKDHQGLNFKNDKSNLVVLSNDKGE
ncbi:MAG: DUF1820 family protein [Desulfobacterales bacterium]|nr:DUF1820 family protein [Desulfobacterales bacterium]